MANAEKNLSVETLRGIAILLVVVGHVVGSGPGGGMKIPDFPTYRYVATLYVWITYYSFSGSASVYGYCRLALMRSQAFSAASSGIWKFQSRKKALCVPCWCRNLAVRVGTLYFLVQYLIAGHQ